MAKRTPCCVFKCPKRSRVASSSDDATTRDDEIKSFGENRNTDVTCDQRNNILLNMPNEPESP